MRKEIFVFVSLLLILHNDAFSEDLSSHDSDALSVMSEEQMVVTPSRHLQSVYQSPSTISVISAEEIQASGATNLPDLLRGVPGMEVMETTSAEHIVSIRGDNQLLANKLLVLIDGRTVHEELENLVFWSSFPIGLNEIERIEIIRGPGSAVWGANAFDGVVNIISKSPADVKGIHIFLTGDGKDYPNGHFLFGGETGSVEYKISGGYERFKKWRDSGAIGKEVYRGNFLALHEFEPGKKVSFSAGISDTPRYDGPLFDNGLGSSGIRQAYLQGGYEEKESYLRVYWNTFNYKTDFYYFDTDPVLFPSSLSQLPYYPDPLLNYAFDLYHVEGQHLFLLFPEFELVTGANYRLTDVRGDLIGGRHQIELFAAYFQGEWTPLDALTLIAGARYDDINFDTMHPRLVSPRESLIYRFETWHQRIRLSHSEAYRTPTPLEMYQTFIALPTSNLNPERIESYEAGYSVLLFEQLTTEINLYYNQLKDLIDVQGISITNLINVDIYGGEISGQLSVNRRLKLFGNYAYQELHQSLEGLDTVLNPYNSAVRAGPTQKINAGGEIKFLRNFTARTEIYYQTAVHFPTTELVGPVVLTDIPAYTQVNFKLGYRFWKDKMELGISVFNLLHAVHREYPLGDEIGSRLLAQLNVEID
ncbi:MAG: TonB-dependent receptor [Nitrospirae bacterium]|nr:TonB-dependent receptor [Nitrospirota bacterium]MBI3594744.1 TonB-dependent receptor [Nitrospirota bacterium]